MNEQVKSLDDEASIRILSAIAKRWIERRGLDAFIIFDKTLRLKEDSVKSLPTWLKDSPSEKDASEAGSLARKMLDVLLAGTDEEVGVWVSDALRQDTRARGHIVDPVTLAIGGAILIGSILAARVKKVGTVEFYKGVPKELADVLQEASAIVVPKS